MRTVDIQNPRIEAVIPNRMEMQPYTIGQNFHPSRFCMAVMVMKPFAASPASRSLTGARPATQKKKIV